MATTIYNEDGEPLGIDHDEYDGEDQFGLDPYDYADLDLYDDDEDED